MQPADAVQNIKSEVRALGAYTLAVTEAPTKLNQNESPFDVPQDFRDEVMAQVAARAWNRYPDFHPADVLEGLGRLHGLDGRHVLLGNGSNELIQAVFGAIVGAGMAVAYPEPTFTLYAMMIAANQGVPRPVRLRADLSYDLEAFAAHADAQDAHLLLCTPNNPTGDTVSRAAVADLASRTPRLVIVDEAYQQFGPDDLSGLVAAHPNVIVLRTFSKALGLAGVRLGYALAHPDLVTQIQKVKLPYNVGIFGLEVARAFLRDPHRFDAQAALIRQERARVAASLQSMPLDAVHVGAANFVLIRTARASALFTALLAQGILVRNVGGYPLLANCLRLSIGTPAQNDVLCAAIAAFLDSATES